MSEVSIRPVCFEDHAAIAALLQPIIHAGETYALPRGWGHTEIIDYWLAPDHRAFVVDDGGPIVGTYFLHANQLGGGAHVANCGYATHSAARGRGIARAMCEHSLIEARLRGFRAMQFNFVVSTNEAAVHLWTALGFAVVGRLPRAFAHPVHGLVDALVMYREL